MVALLLQVIIALHVTAARQPALARCTHHLAQPRGHAERTRRHLHAVRVAAIAAVALAALGIGPRPVSRIVGLRAIRSLQRGGGRRSSLLRPLRPLCREDARRM